MALRAKRRGEPDRALPGPANVWSALRAYPSVDEKRRWVRGPAAPLCVDKCPYDLPIPDLLKDVLPVAERFLAEQEKAN